VLKLQLLLQLPVLLLKPGMSNPMLPSELLLLPVMLLLLPLMLLVLQMLPMGQVLGLPLSLVQTVTFQILSSEGEPQAVRNCWGHSVGLPGWMGTQIAKLGA